METINFATGRTYDTEQVLAITVESQSADEFGFIDLIATFDDKSRHIKGRVQTVVINETIGAAVLCAYDAGRYDSI